jgi:hypothetical protein
MGGIMPENSWPVLIETGPTPDLKAENRSDFAVFSGAFQHGTFVPFSVQTAINTKFS